MAGLVTVYLEDLAVCPQEKLAPKHESKFAVWWREQGRQQHPIAAATTDSSASGQGPKYDLVTSVHRHYTGGFLAELLQELVKISLGDCGRLASTGSN